MRETNHDGNGHPRAAQLPLESPGSNEHHFEVRFGIPQAAGGVAEGARGAVQWARPDTARGDEAQRRLADEARRWAALPDGRRSQLRGLLRQLDTAVVRLRPSTEPAALRELDGAVTALRAALDLGPEPILAACPVCGRLGMAGATVCRYCWTSLRPRD